MPHLKVYTILGIYSSGDRSCLTCNVPCSSAYSVNIACYVLWAVSLHHPVNRGEVQTTSSNICRKQYTASLSLHCNRSAVKAVLSLWQSHIARVLPHHRCYFVKFESFTGVTMNKAMIRRGMLADDSLQQDQLDSAANTFGPVSPDRTFSNALQH